MSGRAAENGGSSMYAAMASHAARPTASEPAKYKTILCANFSNTGRCPYRGKCLFAHGAGELRGTPPASPAAPPGMHDFPPLPRAAAAVPPDALFAAHVIAPILKLVDAAM